jgi:flagellar biosynthesis protein FliQ
MDEALILELARESILVTLQVSGPFLLLALVVGVLISLFQTLTQIQEMTLTFGPKVVVMFVALLVLLPFVMSTLITFTERLMDRIISLS